MVEAAGRRFDRPALRLFAALARPLEARAAPIGVAALSLWALLYIACGWLNVASYGFGAVDEGLYLHGLWLAGQGRAPVTQAYFDRTLHVWLGNHFMPGGYLLGWLLRPLFALWETPFWVAPLEALSYCASAWLVYRTAALIVRPLAALLATALFVGALLPDGRGFHFENLAVPFVALGCYLTYRGRLWPALLAWLVACTFKDYLCWVLPAFGPLWYARGQRRLGGALLLVGIAWFPAVFFGVMKRYQPSGGLLEYPALDGSHTLLALLAQDPRLFAARLFAPDLWWYAAQASGAFALLPLLSPVAAAALPIALVSALGDSGLVNRSHYTIMYSPLLAIGACEGWRTLRGWALRRSPTLRRGLYAALLATLLALLALDARFYAYRLHTSLSQYAFFAAHTRDVGATLALIPPGASVAAEEPLEAHLFARARLVHLSNAAWCPTSYVLFDDFYPHMRARLAAQIDRRWLPPVAPANYAALVQHDGGTTKRLPPAGRSYALMAQIGTLRLYRSPDAGALPCPFQQPQQ